MKNLAKKIVLNFILMLNAQENLNFKIQVKKN